MFGECLVVGEVLDKRGRSVYYISMTPNTSNSENVRKKWDWVLHVKLPTWMVEQLHFRAENQDRKISQMARRILEGVEPSLIQPSD